MLSAEFAQVWCLRLTREVRCSRVSSAGRKCYGNATYELCGNVENGLEGEPPPAEVEEILKARTEELHHQGVVLPARAEVVHLRYTLYMCDMNYRQNYRRTDRQKQITPQITPSMRDIISLSQIRTV